MTTAARRPAFLVAPLVACLALLGCDTFSNIGTTGGNAEGEETSVFDVEAGDCFNVADTDPVETVELLPCDQPHVYEAYAVFDAPGGPDDPYPGQDEMIESANASCEAQFEGYIGLDYQSSEFYITSVNPSEETWAMGDREIICTVATEDEDEVTGSARGSGR